jgi:N-acetylated-alpha-linked acidic dipeptidase
MNQLYQPTNPLLEKTLLSELSSEEPWALIERFSTLTRESDSEDEREAASYITSRLDKYGIPYQVYHPDLFLSVPVSAALLMEGRKFRAKTPSFSITTGEKGVTGEVEYFMKAPAEKTEDRSPLAVKARFISESGKEIDVKDKIALVEGFGFEGAVYQFEQLGARGLIYINPGEYIHNGICTTIWGAPDLDSAPRQPHIPVVTINSADGELLKRCIQEGKTEVTLMTQLKEGWFSCPLIVAEIEGQLEPERFLLVHGHYDSWDVGIGDNAVGDATLLELARVFNKHRSFLARSLKVAWWPGHSMGRYAGSTWFADQFGLELAKNCIAHVDIDSPGCRGASEYYDVTWMKEAEDFCIQAIQDATGKRASGRRPLQAGDYSFNNIGVTGFFLLLSSMPQKLILDQNLYPVGGCGGNNEWHTEHDTLEVADRDNLMRDLRVYVISLERVINNPIHPFDFRQLAQEFLSTLTNYAHAAGEEINFRPAFNALSQLKEELDTLYQHAQDLADREVNDPEVRRINDKILNLARILIPINFTRHGRFRTEPSVPIPPLPDLAPALEIKQASGHARFVIRTHLQRGMNRVVWSFEQAVQMLRT